MFWIDWPSVQRFFEVMYTNWDPEQFAHRYTMHASWHQVRLYMHFHLCSFRGVDTFDHYIMISGSWTRQGLVHAGAQSAGEGGLHATHIYDIMLTVLMT